MATSIAVILNVDADHLDYFGSLENVIQSFHKFASLATRVVIANGNDANTMEAVKDISEDKRILFGTDDAFSWTAKNIGIHNGSYGEYDLYHDGEFLTHIRLGVPGEHNVINSLAAAAAAALCGASPAHIAEGLETFHGAGRRFEFLGTFAGVTIADDYAHHPTEISATLSAAKNMGYQRVWAVFQPFTYTRTARHLDGFVESLSLADNVVVSDIMGSREENTVHVSSEQITDRIPGAVYLPTFPEIADYVAERVSPGDMVLTMGGGDVYKCARMIAQKLREKEASTL